MAIIFNSIQLLLYSAVKSLGNGGAHMYFTIAFNLVFSSCHVFVLWLLKLFIQYIGCVSTLHLASCVVIYLVCWPLLCWCAVEHQIKTRLKYTGVASLMCVFFPVSVRIRLCGAQCNSTHPLVGWINNSLLWLSMICWSVLHQLYWMNVMK